MFRQTLNVIIKHRYATKAYDIVMTCSGDGATTRDAAAGRLTCVKRQRVAEGWWQ